MLIIVIAQSNKNKLLQLIAGVPDKGILSVLCDCLCLMLGRGEGGSGLRRPYYNSLFVIFHGKEK